MCISTTAYCEKDSIEDIFDFVLALLVDDYFFALAVESDGDRYGAFDEFNALSCHVVTYFIRYLLIESSQ